MARKLDLQATAEGKLRRQQESCAVNASRRIPVLVCERERAPTEMQRQAALDQLDSC